MKTLWQIMSEKFTLDQDPDCYLYNYKEVQQIIESLLNEYEQTVAEEPGTPDVTQWFFQAIQELRNATNSSKPTNEVSK